MEKKYDDETDHRMNFGKQIEWDSYIYDRLMYYKQIYDKGKKKFVKFSESPVKGRKNRWRLSVLIFDFVHSYIYK